MIRNLKWILAPLMLMACEESNQFSAVDQQKLASTITQSGAQATAATTVASGKIYYLAGYPGDLYRVNTNGMGDTRLTTDGKNGNLDVSSDGSKIVFANSSKNNWNIYIADISTGSITNKSVLYGSRYRDEDCKFSKDGSKVVFKTNRFGIEQFNNSSAYDICVINVATGVVTKLTSNSNAEAWAPCFSPDGTKIAFVLRPNSQGASGDEIYMIDSNGSNLKRITNNSYADWYPSFSASGNLIYVSQKVASCDDDLYQITASALTLSDPGSQATVLSVSACNAVSDADPYCSKVNENDLSFVSNRNGGYGIYFGDKSTGSVSTVITKSGVDLLGPVLIE